MIRAIDKWLVPWIGSRLRRRPSVQGVRHLVFCVADHFEPFRGEQGETEDFRQNAQIPKHPSTQGPNQQPATSNSTTGGVGDVQRWTEQYRAALSSFRDADGRWPRHTFFYPAEDYDADCIEHLAGFCREGAGEVEVQLHHRNDTADGFCEKIELFKNQLQQHSLLGMDSAGRRKFGFVHGNWSLCNSRPDGDWCGVNEELGLLSKLGCYADFTFPSAPSPTQPRMVNCIYRAVDRAGSPGGCERGRRIADCTRLRKTTPRSPLCYETEDGILSAESGSARHGAQASGGKTENSGLMLITGPVGVRWDGLRPRLENSALTSANMPGAARVKFWVDTGISIAGRPDWVFVKVHMHGFTELNGRLISDGLPEMHRYLQEHYNDGTNWRLHYATAREMYNAVRALESGNGEGMEGWRDFEIAAP